MVVTFKQLNHNHADYGLSNKLDDMLVMSKTTDPFREITPGPWAWATWFEGLFKDLVTGTVHLRHIHYVLVSQVEPIWMVGGRAEGFKPSPTKQLDGSSVREGYKVGDVVSNLYENTDYCWVQLQLAAKHARTFGLIDGDAFEDKRSPQSYMIPSHGGFGVGGGGVEHRDTDGCFSDTVLHLSELPSNPRFAPNLAVHNTHTHLLVIVAEKEGLSNELIPLCRKLGVSFIPCRGEISITECNKLMRWCEANANGRPIRMFSLGDFDPAGRTMTTSLARKVEYYVRDKYENTGELMDVQVTRMGLTYEQIMDLDLPRTPLKDTEKRKDKFEDLYGEGAVELDALVVLKPGELQRIVRKDLEPFITHQQEIHNQRVELQRDYNTEAMVAVDEAVEEFTEELDIYRQELDNINSSFNARFTELLEEYKQASSDVIDSFNEVYITAVEAAKDAVPEEPDEVEFDSVDIEDALMDTHRDYCEQLVHYNTYMEGI